MTDSKPSTVEVACIVCGNIHYIEVGPDGGYRGKFPCDLTGRFVLTIEGAGRAVTITQAPAEPRA